MDPKEITLQGCDETITFPIFSNYVLGLKCEVKGHIHHEPCQDCVHSIPK